MSQFNSSDLTIPTDFPCPIQSLAPTHRSERVLNSELRTQLETFANANDLPTETVLLSSLYLLLSKYSVGGEIKIVVSGHPSSSPRMVSICWEDWVRDLTVGRLCGETELRLRASAHSLSDSGETEVGIDSVVASFLFTDSCSENSGEADANENAPTPILEFKFMIGDEIRVACEYRTDAFRPESISNVLGYYCCGLSNLTLEPEQIVRRTLVMNESELVCLLNQWSKTEVQTDGRRVMLEEFNAAAHKCSDAIAVVDGSRQITYGTLKQWSDQIAVRLLAAGAQAEEPVVVCLPKGFALVAAAVGIISAGCCYVPTSIDDPPERVNRVMDQCKARFVVSLPEHSGHRSLNGHLIHAHFDSSMPANRIQPHPVTPDSLAYIIFTSGSTGEPKGVMVSHGNLCNHLEWRQNEFGIYQSEGVLLKASLTFDASIYQLFWPLDYGGTVVVVSEEAGRDPLEVASIVANHRVPFVGFVSSQLSMAMDALSRTHCECLREIMTGGEVLPASIVNSVFLPPNTRLSNLYGPTETTVISTIWRANELRGRTSAPIGKPVRNTSVYLLDSDAMPMPVGAESEILIGGDGVARGYVNDPLTTASRFVPDPFSARAMRLYRTGDLARFLPSGDLEFIARIDRQIKVRGCRIEAGEIESAIMHLGEFHSVAVAVRSEKLVAYIVPKSAGQEITTETLIPVLAEKLPAYMLPHAVVSLKEMPFGSSAKVDYSQLPDPFSSSRAKDAYDPPEDEMENQIFHIWKEVLRSDQFGIRDNFFFVGGDSLSLGRVGVRIQEKFGVKIPLRRLMDHPTLKSMSEAVMFAILDEIETG